MQKEKNSVVHGNREENSHWTETQQSWPAEQHGPLHQPEVYKPNHVLIVTASQFIYTEVRHATLLQVSELLRVVTMISWIAVRNCMRYYASRKCHPPPAFFRSQDGHYFHPKASTTTSMSRLGLPKLFSALSLPVSSCHHSPTELDWHSLCPCHPKRWQILWGVRHYLSQLPLVLQDLCCRMYSINSH